MHCTRLELHSRLGFSLGPGLLRFLRARHSLSASTKMLTDAIKYLSDWNLEKQREDVRKDAGPENEIARAFSPCGTHGVDRRGVPVCKFITRRNNHSEQHLVY